jgi:flagellar M-ring protein FliF
MGFDKNDIMRAAELGVLALVAILMMLFVVRPLLKTAGAGAGRVMLTGPGGAPLAAAPDGTALQIPVDHITGQPLQIAAASSEIDQRIDIARIEGQVKASSLKRVSEFVEKHPEESVSILRTWLHDTA